MKHLFSQIPNMIDTVLQKATDIHDKNGRPEAAAARAKLFHRLRRVNAELKTYSQQEGKGMVQQKPQKYDEEEIKAAIKKLNDYCKKGEQLSFPFMEKL